MTNENEPVDPTPDPLGTQREQEFSDRWRIKDAIDKALMKITLECNAAIADIESYASAHPNDDAIPAKIAAWLDECRKAIEGFGFKWYVRSTRVKFENVTDIDQAIEQMNQAFNKSDRGEL